LIEAGDGIAYMACILQRLLALFGKGELPVRYVIPFFLIQLAHVISLLPAVD
jgi:hypothetical protein